MRIQKFPPNLLPPLFRILCFTLLYSLVLEKHAWNNRSPAYKPETFPHCPRQKSVLIGNVWIFSLLAMCDQFVMYQSCQCIHLLCKFRRHLYFFGWRYDDVTRHSAAWYIYMILYMYIYIYMLYVGFVQRFANREIKVEVVLDRLDFGISHVWVVVYMTWVLLLETGNMMLWLFSQTFWYTFVVMAHDENLRRDSDGIWV